MADESLESVHARFRLCLDHAIREEHNPVLLLYRNRVLFPRKAGECRRNQRARSWEQNCRSIEPAENTRRVSGVDEFQQALSHTNTNEGNKMTMVESSDSI